MTWAAIGAAGVTAIGAAASSSKGSSGDQTIKYDYGDPWIKSYSTEQQDELYAMLMPYLKAAFGGDTGGATTVPYKKKAGQQTVKSLSPYQGVSGYGSKPTSLPWV